MIKTLDSKRLFRTMGVEFHWFGEKSESKVVGENLSTRLLEIQQQLLPILKRQKRKHLDRWDLLTYIATSKTADAITKHNEWRTLERVLRGLGHQSITTDAVRDFVQLPSMKNVPMEVAFLPNSARADEGHGRMPKWDGRDPGDKDQFVTIQQVNADSLPALPGADPSDRFILLLAMVEVRDCLVQKSLLGRPTIARCQSTGCGSWFSLPAMSAKSKFCSAYCRVSHMREKK